MRFYNKIDDPSKEFWTHNICLWVGNKTEFSKVSYSPWVSHCLPQGGILIGALGTDVTQFYNNY